MPHPATQRIALGLWPIAGITTIGVTRNDAQRTIATAMDCGITTFDTAFSYGYEGESDKLLGEAIQANRERFTVVGKVGQRWSGTTRVIDGSQAQLLADAETSIARLNIGYFDLLFLHSPDPNVPLAESASAFQILLERKLCHRVGISNMTLDQMTEFSSEIACSAIQCPLNLVQPQSLSELIASAHHNAMESYTYWSLMKGLLAGNISRDHVFQEGDSRPGYAIFQGELREAIHAMMDALAPLAQDLQLSMAQLAVSWVISQTGVTAALVGARRPEQIEETAGARVLPPDVLQWD